MPAIRTDTNAPDAFLDMHPIRRIATVAEVAAAVCFLAGPTAEFDRRHRDRGIRAASVMPGNSLTDLPRHFSQEELQGLFATVGKARADAGLPATSVWAAVVADTDEIGGKYLEDVAVAAVNDTPNPFADGVRSYALDPTRAGQLWARSEALVGAV
jgi:NAD(P)-dependent dehydrogenase (short-subunit alcohol dehydrogenase family)